MKDLIRDLGDTQEISCAELLEILLELDCSDLVLRYDDRRAAICRKDDTEEV